MSAPEIYYNKVASEMTREKDETNFDGDKYQLCPYMQTLYWPRLREIVLRTDEGARLQNVRSVVASAPSLITVAVSKTK